jgi:hypothetical protein
MQLVRLSTSVVLEVSLSMNVSLVVLYDKINHHEKECDSY